MAVISDAPLLLCLLCLLWPTLSRFQFGHTALSEVCLVRVLRQLDFHPESRRTPASAVWNLVSSDSAPDSVPRAGRQVHT